METSNAIAAATFLTISFVTTLYFYAALAGSGFLRFDFDSQEQSKRQIINKSESHYRSERKQSFCK